MRIVSRKDIDDDAWNNVVEGSKVQNYVLYTWAMDATAENWCAVVKGDYDFILPIPFTVNLGVKRARQQAYSRQVDFIGDKELLPKAMEMLREEFLEFDVRFSKNNLGVSDQCFQALDLRGENQYSKNAKRLIKKVSDYHYVKTDSIDLLMQLYTENTHQKLNQPKENLTRLALLMENCLKNHKGYVFNAIKNNEVVGACFIMEDKLTAIYLIADASYEEKKKGVIYGMMDYAIKEARERKMKQFDFGGSNVDSVAQFYKKFGAKDVVYTRVFWDSTPAWFKLIRKLKNRMK